MQENNKNEAELLYIYIKKIGGQEEMKENF